MGQTPNAADPGLEILIMSKYEASITIDALTMNDFVNLCRFL